MTVFSCVVFCIKILNPQPITKTLRFCENLDNFCDKAAPHSIPEAPSLEVNGCNGCSEVKLVWRIFYHFVMLESLGC